MKKQILTLIIGILIGAIIATGVFLVLKNNSGDRNDRGERPEMQGEMPSMDENMIGEPGGPKDNMRQDNNGDNTILDSNTTSSET